MAQLALGTHTYNVKETALMAIQTLEKVLVGKESRHFNQAISAEHVHKSLDIILSQPMDLTFLQFSFSSAITFNKI